MANISPVEIWNQPLCIWPPVWKMIPSLKVGWVYPSPKKRDNLDIPGTRHVLPHRNYKSWKNGVPDMWHKSPKQWPLCSERIGWAVFALLKLYILDTKLVVSYIRLYWNMESRAGHWTCFFVLFEGCQRWTSQKIAFKDRGMKFYCVVWMTIAGVVTTLYYVYSSLCFSYINL